MKKYTVITICLNMEEEIGDTIASILHQTSSDFEYIIKDGISKDNTVSVAESFAPAFAERGIDYRILSQKDSGIYDAMNQATAEATGEWVIYMNAGDQFADKMVLERVTQSGCLEKADVVYGDRILKNRDLYCYKKPYPLEEMRVGLPFGHQSAFTRRELLGKHPYSLKYRICSDYHCLLKMYREKRRFCYLPIAICIYDVNGFSAVNWEPKYWEIIHILEEVPPRDEEAIQRMKVKIKESKRTHWLHKHIFQYIPKSLRLKRRARMDRQAGWRTAEETFALGRAEK